MKLFIKLILIGALFGTGFLLWWWLTRRNSTTTSPAADGSANWAVLGSLQATQLTTLSGQMQDRITRDEATSLLTQSNGNNTTIINTPNRSDVSIAITSDGQTAFVVDANETRKKLFLNGVKLQADQYQLAPPALTYVGSIPLETDDELTLTD